MYAYLNEECVNCGRCQEYSWIESLVAFEKIREEMNNLKKEDILPCLPTPDAYPGGMNCPPRANRFFDQNVSCLLKKPGSLNSKSGSALLSESK